MHELDDYNICFSGGRSSALMTLELLKQDEYKNASVIFANTGKENEATLKFVHQLDCLIGNRIVWVEYADNQQGFIKVDYLTASRDGEPFAALIKKRKFVPNIMARFCSQELKIRPTKKYIQQVLGWKHWISLVGIRYDEPRRWSKSKSVTYKDVFEVEHPLVKWKINKPDVLAFWKDMPFDLELKDYEGNCDCCFLKGKKKKMAIVRNTPKKFDWWIGQENLTGGRFCKDYSYQSLIDMMKKAPELFTIDDTVDCFCNID